MKYILVAAVCTVLCSCEKEIKLDVQNQPAKLVVDASIENNNVPVVALSNSLNYFSSISAKELSNSFVHDAVVTVSDGTITAKLKEYSFTDTSGFTVYYYSVDSADLSSIIVGAFERQYKLGITTKDGQTYTSTTTIPALTKKVDSLWWKPISFTDDTTLCALVAKATDPSGLGNYIRYFTKVNSGRFLPGLNSVFDDQVVDGITYTLQFDAGWDKNSLENPASTDDYGFVRRGDTVTLKYCNIDKATYTFWSTWEFAWQSYGNPFSSPGKVLGNISNGALGAFSGYAAQYKTIIIPK
ncbi:DUF4249 domain-containing protein [Panacibacter ginsenosidivorans]|uniref:DUF4249 domain-containing protein n=1 Tax=Panacibacter ginsenosidivorans TaxID=1813871 RepID=A0A5B8V698_9BACT|nr:DUF4249 domain-containing protein [Panacibacter ginsenosidivorans]QEC66934.1 DUF4249 domain-containing protein [Panacibacter ginsenosidivorans]